MMKKKVSQKAAQEPKKNTIHGFDLNGFVDWLYTIGYETDDDNREFEMVKRVIQYGLNHKMVFKDEFCYWISDMIPGVGILDVAAFMNRGRLSEELIAALEAEGRTVA